MSRHRARPIWVLSMVLSLVALSTFGGCATDTATTDPTGDALTTQADPLTFLPPDTTLALVAPNAAQASATLQGWWEAIKSHPLDTRPIEGLLEAVNIADGFDPNRMLALATTTSELASLAFDDDYPSLAILVPVTDYDAFLSNFDEVTSDGALTRFTWTMNLSSSDFTKQWTAISMPGYALIGGSDDVVQSVLDRDEPFDLPSLVGRMGVDVLSDSDLALLVDLERLSPSWRAGINMAFDVWSSYFPTGADDDAFADMTPIIDLYREGFDTMLRDSQGFILGFNQTDDQLNMLGAVQFLEDSEMASVFGPSATPNALSQLPGGDYIVAAQADFEGLDLHAIADAAMTILPDDDSLAGVVRASVDMVRNLNDFGMAVYPVAPGEAATAFSTLAVYDIGDAEAALDQYETVFNRLHNQNLPVAMHPEGDSNEARHIRYSSLYETGAADLNGRRIDRYQLFTDTSELPQHDYPGMEFWRAITRNGDESGLLMADGARIWTSTDWDVDHMAEVLALPEDGTLNTSIDLEALRQRGLYLEPSCEVYINIPSAVRLLTAHAAAADIPVELAVEATGGPAHFFCYTDEASAAGQFTIGVDEVHLLRQAIRAFKTGFRAE